MARGKSPGLSGFPVDLYVIFWNQFKELLFQAYNYAIENGILHKTAHEGLITLLPKKERNLLYVKNWRPIVLLNTDFKIFSKIVAERIKSVLPDIIHKDQSGFIKGRQGIDNIRKLLDIIATTEDLDIPEILVSLDFQKAFDNVEYNVVYRIMEWFNFGPFILSMIKILFNKFSLYNYNNGYISEGFIPTKGLFQGNPVAPYLFIIVIEYLATRIRQNKKIKGVKIREEEFLQVLFADDVGLLLDADKRSWQEAVK